MADPTTIPDTTLDRLRWPLWLTGAGMVAERATQAFWPFVSVVMVGLGLAMFGVQDHLGPASGRVVAGLVTLFAILALIYGLRRFVWPGRGEIRTRLDRSLPGRPLSAVLDDLVLGSDDPQSRALWDAHINRMAARAALARPVPPDLRVSRRDPYALRYVATVGFVMALLFGSVFQVTTVAGLVTPGAVSGVGPGWEGWIEPPAYTGKPTIYLADMTTDSLTVAQGSQLTLRLYGKVGALRVIENISGKTGPDDPVAEPDQTIEITQSGNLAIDGPGGASWQINVLADQPPTIALGGKVERTVNGEMRLPFTAADDYGVRTARAEMVLDIAGVDRRHGLGPAPEARDPILLDLPMPYRGDRRALTETVVDNLAQHPWAGLPVIIRLFASDGLGQTGTSGAQTITLPGRRFFDPLAAALIEQRRDLLWNRQNARRVAQILRAVSHRPADVNIPATAYLKLRVVIRRLEGAISAGGPSGETRDETTRVLWDIATLIEDGNLSDAKERLRQAQERLEQAMRDGASDEEIAKLMDDLREAMQDYMQQLAQNSQKDGSDLAENENTQEITGQQLQQMLDRLQELMEQGRMAEAQELMEQLRQMMENMQVTQGGQGQPSPGQQAMDGLADTLRRQQGLSDDTFGDMQGENGQGQGLAGRQQALRDQLGQQSQALEGGTVPGGGNAGEALGRAGRAMEDAEQALRQGDLSGALDQQADALEALREGMRELAEGQAEQQGQQPGQQGQEFGRANGNTGNDPLGRDTGAAGRTGTEQDLLQGEDVYRRARELLDEIRRRSSDQGRPEIELDYLKRLLDRF